MTRVIKFRAWDGYSMLKDVQTWTDDFTDMLNETFKMWANPELGQHLKLMQFTGLLDKNGEEIYEYMEIDNIYEVSFKGGRYILTNISSGDVIALYNYMENKSGQVEITREYTKV